MINKKDLVKRAADRLSGIKKSDLAIVTDELFNTIIDVLKEGESIYVAGFGKFSVAERKEIQRKTPTGDVVTIPAHKEPKFKFFKAAKAEFC